MFLKKKCTYLDSAAGALANPSSPHEEGRHAKEVLEGARTAIARLVEAKPDDVVFTGGATEANALAILGVANRRQQTVDSKDKLHVLYLPSAHASIVENALMLRERGVEVEPLSIKAGRVDIDALKKMIRPETALITMEAVCGETGTIWNTREVAQVLSEAAAPLATCGIGLAAGAHRAEGVGAALLHVDASQAPHTEKLTRAHYRADLLVFDGSKVGVRGTGCLIAPRTLPLAPLYKGGGQERGLRSGTENVEAITAFAAALALTAKGREPFAARAATMRAKLIAQLSGIANLYINEGAENAPHILNISLLGRDTDYLVALLDKAGFGVSTKSACETDSGEGSRAVLALSGDSARASSTLRISWGPTTSARDLHRFARALHEAVRFVDSARSIIAL